MNQKQSTRRN